MTFPASPETRRSLFGLLRIAGSIAVLAGAAGSMIFLRSIGHSTPAFLLILFIGWVLLPFVGLLAAGYLSKRWAAGVRHTLCALMLVVPLVSVTIYGYVARTGPAKPAAAFLMVPLASWMVIALALAIAAWASRPAQ